MMLPRSLSTLLITFLACTASHALLRAQVCVRPQPGSQVEEPADLHSRNGVLEVELSVHNGGTGDSGYVQPLDYFGDGTRIPLIVVSPFNRAGRITHNYGDHVSILKFIERNWALSPISKRSRDNFPNPVAEGDNPYVPVNSPALSDLFELFEFPQAK